MAIEQAIVLCGGRGTRLGELAREVPKPMVPVGGRPVLDFIIEALAAGGVKRVVLAAGHLGHVIAEAYARPRFPGCTVETVIEPAPRGTAGSLAALADRLDEEFLVAYGDVFLDFDVHGLIEAHERWSPLGTLLTRASDHPWDSHLLETDAAGRVTEFVHRREPGRLYRNLANAACYALSRRVLEFIPKDRASDFGADVFPAALAAGEELRVHELEPEGFVKDMGTPARLAAVGEYLEERAAARQARENADR